MENLEDLFFPILIVLALAVPVVRRWQENRRRAAWRASRAERTRPRRLSDAERRRANGRPPDEVDQV